MTLTDGRIGQLLDGKYRVEEFLARGGMGLVYGARHQATARAVAIKLLRSELVTRSDLVRRVSAEARLAVEASHPNVVQVLDAGADDRGVPYLVLERLFGHTLEAILSRPLSLLATAQALIPIMNALSALHRTGIVHRDIKPANLFLSRDAQGRVTPKLLDFGIAKALEGSSSTLSGTALGTPAYMAPEQALGCRSLGPQTDVWSMGIVFVRCLTLTLPFDAKAAHRVGVLLSGLEDSDLGGIAAPVARVLAQALRVEALERFENMAAFRDSLLAALASVDASLDWPGETSVSYAPSVTELAARLDSVNPERSDAEDTTKRARGRHGQIATRTLSSRAQRSPARRPTRGLLVAALALSATLLAAGVRYAAFPSGFSAPTPAAVPPSAAEAVAARPDEPTLSTLAAPEPARDGQSAPTPFGTSGHAPSARGRRAAANGASGPAQPRIKVLEPTPAHTPETAPMPVSVSESSQTAPKPPRVGANHAPIIE